MTKPLRIAVADGEVENRRYYERILPQMGHAVVGSVASACDLKDLCRNGSPDLIIVDEMLPGLCGGSGARGLTRMVDIPVVIVSSSDVLYEDLEIGYGNSVRYLVRPFKSSELASAIESASRHTSDLNSLYD